MLVTRGAAANVVQYDRREAYLRAMEEPLPVPGTWRTLHGCKPATVLKLDGFAFAKVLVDPFGTAVGHLPVEIRGATVHPVGTVVGIWPIHWLRAAAAADIADVQEVYDAQACDVAPLAVPLAERFRGVSYKPLRRLLYTRWWGRLASRGWWAGTLDGAGRRIAGVSWRWSGKELLDPLMRPDFRPDWSAFIASRNALVMHAAIKALGGEVPQAHVDALWCDSGAAETLHALDPGGWKVKSSGDLRSYSIGRYVHGSRIGAAGFPSWKSVTVDELEAHGTSWGTATHRQWRNGVGPAESPDAVSDVRYVNMAAQQVEFPTWERALWTADGFQK
jgi:hypothetical protein